MECRSSRGCCLHPQRSGSARPPVCRGHALEWLLFLSLSGLGLATWRPRSRSRSLSCRDANPQQARAARMYSFLNRREATLATQLGRCTTSSETECSLEVFLFSRNDQENINIRPSPAHCLMDPEAQKENTRAGREDEKVVAEIRARRYVPGLITSTAWEGFRFAGHDIRITEATDCYGAVVWPSALVLCYFLETNVKQYNMVDKNVIEIGAGTGLVSIVASLLGARVTATDLPELLGNLQYNISRNTKSRCQHVPQVRELSWGVALDRHFPRSANSFDYVLAADVVYAHPFLDELLATFDHLCKETTVILWVMRFRLERENKFVDRFKELFDLEEICSFPSLSITLYRAVKKNRRSA